MSIKIQRENGITLLELMIAILLTGLVFAVAMSIYSSSIKFMNLQGASTDPTQSTVVALEEISKRISVCNEAVAAGGILHLRCDYAPNTFTAFNTPGVFTDDGYWHFGFSGGALKMLSDGPSAVMLLTDPAAAGAVVIPNVDIAASSVAVISSASGVGTVGTKVDISIKTSVSPITEVRTSTILGAKATR